MPPVSNGSGALPGMEVALWTLLPLLIQVTLPPVTIVTEAGWKPLSVMVMTALDCGPAGVGVGVEAGAGAAMGAFDSHGKRSVLSRLTSPPGPLIQVL